MRKFLLTAAALAMAAVAVVPAFAQDNPTLAEVVVGAASADTPEFSPLLDAVSAAAPAVLEALSNPDAELTVFAPTDAAFSALAEALGEDAFAAVLADPAALTNILLFHVVDGIISSSDLVAAFPEAGATIQIPVLNGQNLAATLNEDGSITLEGGATIVATDVEASNGVVHVIDAVLLPETRTIAEIVTDSATAEMPEFSVLLTAVGAADPAVLEALSDPEAELTVFAPTDAAFGALIEALGEDAFNAIVADPATLSDILLYHVIAAKVSSTDLVGLFSADMLPEGVEMNDDGALVVTMANGATATISATEDGVFINDAMISIVDIDAANGVIHVIDAVIVPPRE